MKISVLGDGGWGTTLAILLSRKKKDVVLWSVSKPYAAYINKYRRNPKFLSGIKIPSKIKITSDLKAAVADSDLVIVAIPSVYLRKVVRKLKSLPKLNKKLFVSVTKGIEINTLKRMSEVIKEELGPIRIAVLSGPTIALEVAKNHPTTAVIAGKNDSDLRFLQHLFTGPRFRVYTNRDEIGVELGGSLKNIIAIACGISDGLGFGTNSKAAILSRGLNEMRRLALAMGARAETLNGISGLGDLVTTCVSKFSRNRFVGEQLAKGIAIKKIVSKMQMIAEGITTVKSAHSLSVKYKLDLPIINEIYQVIYRGKSAIKAVNDLMSRRLKPE